MTAPASIPAADNNPPAASVQLAENVDAPEGSVSLWRAFARSVRHNTVGEITVQVLRTGAMVMLARLLHPSDFGLFRMLLAFVLPLTALCEVGIPDALIQRPHTEAAHETMGWWICLLASATVSGTLYCTSSAIAHLMRMADLGFALRLVCVPIVLEGASIAPNARLRRELRFGALATADVVAEIGFLTAAFALIWCRLDRWSLAGALAARLGVHGLAVCVQSGGVPLGKPSFKAAVDLRQFSLSVLAGRIVTALSDNADYILVGRLLGSGALGIYAMAWDLLRFIPDRLHKVAGRVTLPAFCRLQHDDRELGRAFAQFSGYLARVIFPLLACLAIAAPEFVRTVYGAQWLPAALPLRLLTFGLAFAGLRLGSVYFAKGHPEFEIYTNTLRLVGIVTVVLLLWHHGLFGVSLGVSAVEASISAIHIGLACQLIGLRWRTYLAAWAPGAWIGLWCALAAAAGKFVAIACGIHGPAALAVLALPPAVTFFWRALPEIRYAMAMAFTRQQANT